MVRARNGTNGPVRLTLDSNYLTGKGLTYAVKDGEGGNDRINQIDASQDTTLVGRGEEGHESTSDDTALSLETAKLGLVGIYDKTYPGMMQTMIQAQR